MNARELETKAKMQMIHCIIDTIDEENKPMFQESRENRNCQ
jgi:hypothetical protein